MVRVGFIGLGAMGNPMAQHVLDDGHELTVFDVRNEAMEPLVEAGADPADSAAAAAADAEAVILSLPSSDIVEDVVLGSGDVASAMDSDDTLIDMTTSLPAKTDEIESQLNERGVEMLGVPVSGGADGAKEGTLTAIGGGDPDIFDEFTPIFETFSSNVFHVGSRPRDGHTVKLLNQGLVFTNIYIACEAAIVGRQAGVDLETILEVVNTCSGRNSATEGLLPEEIATEEYDVDVTVDICEKDLRYFTQLGEENHVPTMLGSTTRNLYGYALDEYGKSDLSRIYDFAEEMMLNDTV